MKLLDVMKPYTGFDPEEVWPLEVAFLEAKDARDVAPELWAEVQAKKEAEKEAERQERSRRQNTKLRRSGRRMMRSIKEATGGRTDT